MENKKIWLGILVMVLVFGIVAVGCKTDEEGDSWSNVTSLTQVAGTWKGSYSQTQSQGGASATIVQEQTITINATNATTGTMSGSAKITYTYSGISEADWNSIKQSASGMTVTFNDATHSMTMTQPISSQSISLSNYDGAQLNQNGTKLKVPAQEDSPEIIFTKQ